MSTVNYTSFLSEVLPYAHDCPQFVAINAIRNASIEFCQKTRIWQQDLPAIDIVANQPNYVIAVPTDTVLAAPMEMWIQGRLLIPKSPEELTRIYRGVDWRTQTSASPSYYLRTTLPEVYLVLTPNTAITAAITMRAALAPSRASQTIDTTLYENFAEWIGKGALARLYSTPGQPYFDMNLASMMRREFMTKIGEAKIKANKGQSRAAVAIEYQRFV